GGPPVLLTRMCTGRRSTTAATARARPLPSPVSATASACPRSAPPARPETTSRRTLSRRASTVTVAPSAASSSAAARPMPPEAPHTSAWRLERSRSMVGLHSGAPAQVADHLRAQRLVAVALGRGQFGQAEPARQRVFLIQPVVADELGVQQGGAGAVLAVVGEHVAVAVEHLGGTGLAHPQPRPHHRAAQGGKPPFGIGGAGGGIPGIAHAAAHSRDSPVAIAAPRVTMRAIRAGVANPVNAVSGNSRYSPDSSQRRAEGLMKAPSPRRSRRAGLLSRRCTSDSGQKITKAQMPPIMIPVKHRAANSSIDQNSAWPGARG